MKTLSYVLAVTVFASFYLLASPDVPPRCWYTTEEAATFKIQTLTREIVWKLVLFTTTDYCAKFK